MWPCYERALPCHAGGLASVALAPVKFSPDGYLPCPASDLACIALAPALFSPALPCTTLPLSASVCSHIGDNPTGMLGHLPAYTSHVEIEKQNWWPLLQTCMDISQQLMMPSPCKARVAYISSV